MMQHPYWEHAGNGHPWAHVILLILFLMLLVTAAVFLFRLLANRSAPAQQFVPATAGPAAEALNIARLRYARGEIKRAEFLRMSKDFGAPGEEPSEAPTVADEPAAPDS